MPSSEDSSAPLQREAPSRTWPDADYPAIVIEEQVDYASLGRLLMKKQAVAKMIGKDDFNFRQVEKYYSKLNPNGRVKIKYVKSKVSQTHIKAGRFYPEGGVGLAVLPRAIRHTIAGRWVIDIDMQNAHPVILLELCRKHKQHPKYLIAYVNDRERFLNDIAEEEPGYDELDEAGRKARRGEAKRKVLIALNGGAVNDSKICRNMSNEAKKIAQYFDAMNISSKYREQCEERKARAGIESRMMIRLVGQVENEILYHAWNWLADQGERASYLQFDGMGIQSCPMTFDEDCKRIEVLLPALKAAVTKAVGFSPDWAIKAPDEALDLDELEDDNQVELAETTINVKYNHFDVDDPVQKGQVSIALRRKYPSYQAGIDVIVPLLLKTVAKISIGMGFYIVKTSTNDMFHESQLTGLQPMKYLNNKGETMRMSVEQIMQQEDYPQPEFTSISSKPPDKVGPYEFSTWTPVWAARAGPADLEAGKRIINRIKETICNGSEDSLDYLMRWTRRLIVDEERPRIMLFIWSKTHGSGKGVLSQVLRRCIGPEGVSCLKGFAPLLGNHFTSHVGKKLVFFEEAVESREISSRAYANLKDLITEDSTVINPKSKDERSVDLTASYIATSNHSTLCMETNDRRVSVFHCSEVHITEEEGEAWALANLHDEGLRGFYTLLKAMPAWSGYKMPVLKNDARDEIMMQSKKSIELFRDWAKGITDRLGEGHSHLCKTDPDAAQKACIDALGGEDSDHAQLAGMFMHRAWPRTKMLGVGGWYPRWCTTEGLPLQPPTSFKDHFTVKNYSGSVYFTL
jgi:hypothetical protein